MRKLQPSGIFTTFETGGRKRTYPPRRPERISIIRYAGIENTLSDLFPA